MSVEYSIPNHSSNSYTKEEIGKFIFKLGGEEDFYQHFANENYDSLYFYGPDYHHFDFRLTDHADTIKVMMEYFGHHGFKSNPPRKKFLDQVSASLQKKYKANKVIKYYNSNEK